MQRFIFGNVPQREDFNQLRTELTSSLQTLERNMQVSVSQVQTTIQTLENLTREVQQIQTELPPLQRQVQEISLSLARSSAVPGKLDELQKQVSRLATILPSLEKLREEVKGLPERISPLTRTGEGDIGETVNLYSKMAVDTIYALVQEFVMWAEGIREAYYQVQKTQEEANSKMQERLRPPTPKASSNGESDGRTDI